MDKTFPNMATLAMGTVLYFYILGFGLSMILCDHSGKLLLHLAVHIRYEIYEESYNSFYSEFSPCVKAIHTVYKGVQQTYLKTTT